MALGVGGKAGFYVLLVFWIISIIFGFILGTAVVICGAIKGKIGLGIGGFFACLAASALFVSVPVCVLFMYLIFKKKTPEIPPIKF